MPRQFEELIPKGKSFQELSPEEKEKAIEIWRRVELPEWTRQAEKGIENLGRIGRGLRPLP